MRRRSCGGLDANDELLELVEPRRAGEAAVKGKEAAVRAAGGAALDSAPGELLELEAALEGDGRDGAGGAAREADSTH